MNEKIAAENWIRDPLAWAVDCRAQAKLAVETELKDALLQLAEEFDNTASEIDGLVSGYEALVRRKMRTGVTATVQTVELAN